MGAVTGLVRQEISERGVVTLEIDNPPMNAMSNYMLHCLGEALGEIDHDTSVRAILLTGRGRAFCSGADLKEAAETGEDLSLFGTVLEQLAAFRLPVVAAINGHCVGGGLELALCCDLRLASTGARFVCAGVNMGLMASAYRLPRLIGIAHAKAMLLTGLPHDAETALSWGLVTGVHDPENLLSAAHALAARIASRAPLSVEATKRTVDRALDLSPEEGAAQLAREIAPLLRSADHQEAVRAFVERRDPKFARR